MTQTLVVDVFHDTVCPWCRIGKKQLADALASWEGPEVDVRPRPFFLNPTIPPEGYAFASYMRAKFQIDDLEPIFDGPRRMGAAIGLTFNFERIQQAPNSLLSHRLIEIAPPELKSLVLDAVYKAYFEDGQDIGRLDVLIEIIRQAGLNGEAIAGQLRGDAGREEVIMQATWAQQSGITGVPLFLINRQLVLQGAQPAATLRAALQHAAGMTDMPEAIAGQIDRADTGV